jgi:hypothetical protein
MMAFAYDDPLTDPEPGPEPNAFPFATIGQADRLTLFEGLPHQLIERELLASERKTKQTVDLHGYPFYSEPLALMPEDAEKLKALLGDATRFASFSGEKRCGGFHPDYAVEWTVEGQVYHCLVCFGCGEVKIYGPLGESRFDMERDTEKRLRSVLWAYEKNRPAAKHVPG